MSQKLLVIGCGEAFDQALGNTSYLFSGAGFPSILFDCGYQIPERLWAKNLHHDLHALCLTHLHADHSFGIVPLLVRYWEEKRRKPFHIFGPRGTESYVKKLFELGYPGFIRRLEFPIVYHELSPLKSIVWRKLRLTSARTVHSVLNHTVRVDLPGRGGVSFAVSGDGQITEETRSLVDDVELLLQEVYTLEPEVPTHADLQTVASFVNGSRLRKIGVAHQARNSRAEVHAHVRGLARKDRRWLVLKPGLSFPL